MAAIMQISQVTYVHCVPDGPLDVAVEDDILNVSKGGNYGVRISVTGT